MASYAWSSRSLLDLTETFIGLIMFDDKRYLLLQLIHIKVFTS
jgi:hypothetical protein